MSPIQTAATGAAETVLRNYVERISGESSSAMQRALIAAAATATIDAYLAELRKITVTKTSGSQWRGRIVGVYSTSRSNHTVLGFCVESMYERGSVQIYPEHALGVVSMDE